MPELRTRGRIDSARAFELYRAGKTDAEMADALGSTASGVKSWRQRRKLPHNGPPRDASRGEAFLRLYEQGLTDSEIAASTGVGRERVTTWRHGRKLPCHREVRGAVVREDAFLALHRQGKTDREIGEALGCSGNTVGVWRRRHGIAANPSGTKTGRPKGSTAEGPRVQSGPLFMTDREILQSWRMALDRKEQVRILAELNATSVPRMLAKLEELGIDVSPYRRRRTGKLDEVRALELWRQGLDDVSIGRVFGVTDSSVKQWRDANGLAANAGQGRPRK